MSTPLKIKLEHINNDTEFLQEDRLSNLQDNLLITVLSLLPIASAAATSALSHRWCHLWTHTTHLYIHPPRFNLHKFRNFKTTINLILSQLSSPKIHTLSLSIPNTLSPFDEQNLFRWISQICSLNPQVFQLQCCPVYPLQIPNFPFQTQSVEKLQLEFSFECNGNLSINLPNLKKLCLLVGESQLAFLGALFNSVPNLEHLTLSFFFEEQGNVVDIILPNLLSLRLSFHDEMYAEDCRFVIDAPNLEEFHFLGDLAFFHFVNKIKKLQTAKIALTFDER